MAKKTLKDIVLCDNYNYNVDDYRSDFDDFIEVNEILVTDYETNLIEWVNEVVNQRVEDLFLNLTHSPFNTPCVVIGSIGRWDGRYEIIPQREETLISALEKCFSDCDFYRVVLTEGKIEVTAIHHDGRNCFEIFVLNKRGLNSKNGDLRKSYYHKPIDDYLF